jgi:chromate transport protein ChrA
MLLPGPEAQQLATYIGWLMHRTWGGIVAGALFVLPSLFILIALSWIYLRFGDVPLVAGIFLGLKPAVTAIVLHAAHRIGTRALKNRWMWGIAAASFVAIFAFDTPFPAIVLAAALIGHFGARRWPQVFALGGGHGSAKASYGPALIDDHTPTPRTRASRAASWARCWAAASDCGCWRWRVLVATQRPAGHADADGLVLHQGRLAHLRRCLRGAALRLPGRGRNPPVAERPADDRRPGPGRDHARPADHGGGLRRFRRRLAEAGVRA